MKKTIECECGETTWYDSNYTTAFVDAYRMMKVKCRCAEK